MMSACTAPDNAAICACSLLEMLWRCVRESPHCQEGRPAEEQSILPVRQRGHHNSLVNCDVGFDATGGTVGEDDARDGKGQARTQRAPSLPQSPALPVGRTRLSERGRDHARCVRDAVRGRRDEFIASGRHGTSQISGVSPRPVAPLLIVIPLLSDGSSSEATRADQSAAQRKERLMDVRTPLVAHFEAAEAIEPRQGALHYPPVPPKALARLNAATRNARGDAALAQCSTAPCIIVPLVSMQLHWALARPSTASTRQPQWRNRIDRRLQ